VALEPADEAEVLIVVDNYIDVLAAGSETVRRIAPRWDSFHRPALRAEHGLSLVLTVRRNGRTSQVLYDAGMGSDTATHNLDVLEIRPSELRALVISHGHADHHGGLVGLANRYGKSLPLMIHPEAWRERKAVFPNGAETHLPPPNRSDLEAEGVQMVDERGPSLLLDNSVLVTGQVERTTGYEPGFPPQQRPA
jgi:7,8-dihydropterin-6-yl-methyl-4-(beta-D-ribofuranosyl)aminobenzene 5'-phosphate synthase